MYVQALVCNHIFSYQPWIDLERGIIKLLGSYIKFPGNLLARGVVLTAIQLTEKNKHSATFFIEQSYILSSFPRHYTSLQLCLEPSDNFSWYSHGFGRGLLFLPSPILYVLTFSFGFFPLVFSFWSPSFLDLCMPTAGMGNFGPSSYCHWPCGDWWKLLFGNIGRVTSTPLLAFKCCFSDPLCQELLQICYGVPWMF